MPPPHPSRPSLEVGSHAGPIPPGSGEDVGELEPALREEVFHPGLCPATAVFGTVVNPDHERCRDERMPPGPEHLPHIPDRSIWPEHMLENLLHQDHVERVPGERTFAEVVVRILRSLVRGESKVFPAAAAHLEGTEGVEIERPNQFGRLAVHHNPGPMLVHDAKSSTDTRRETRNLL